MKYFIAFLLCIFASLRLYAANPAFSSFDTNQFGVAGNVVRIKNLPLITNIWDAGYLTLSGTTNQYTDDGSQLLRNGSPISGSGGDSIWTNIVGVIQPIGTAADTNVLSFTSGLADNSTNIAFVVDTAVPWTLGGSPLVVRNAGTNFFALFPQRAILELLDIEQNGIFAIDASVGSEEIFFSNGSGVLMDLYPSVASGSAVAYSLDTRNVLTNDDKLVSIGNAGTPVHSIYPNNGGIAIGQDEPNYWGPLTGGEFLIGSNDYDVTGLDYGAIFTHLHGSDGYDYDSGMELIPGANNGSLISAASSTNGNYLSLIRILAGSGGPYFEMINPTPLGGDVVFSINPNDYANLSAPFMYLKAVKSTNDVINFFKSDGTTPIFKLNYASGYTGTGAKFFADDGQFHTSTGGSGTNTIVEQLGPGTVNYLPKWNTTNTLNDSISFQTGTTNITVAGSLGIGSITNLLIRSGGNLIYTNEDANMAFSVETSGGSIQLRGGGSPYVFGSGNTVDLVNGGGGDVRLDTSSFIPLVTLDLGSTGRQWRDIFLTGNLIVNASTNSVGIFHGNGSPEGVVTAGPGSLYIDFGGENYIKTTGTGNTGWKLVTHASIPFILICYARRKQKIQT